MVRRYYDLPSLSALAVFEASARHASFKLAAQELNVTPGAVSRQIKLVEQELGTALFLRNGRGVQLTSSGEDLFRVLASAFSRTSDAVRAIRQGNATCNATVACSDAFAAMWLLPRMPDFWRRYPTITVDHVIWENTSNFRRGDVELRIRFGLGQWVGETAELLFDDCIYPVCSPAFAQQHQGAGIADLADLPLLNVEWTETDWVSWEQALLRSGVLARAVRGRRFGKFSIALQAAIADQGLVIGWHRLVGPLVEQGVLTRFSDLAMPAPGGYYLTWDADRNLSGAAVVMRDWIREMAQSERAQPCPTQMPHRS